jgi:dTDP-4-amino-4,6-dideoxygalactose transaminase
LGNDTEENMNITLGHLDISARGKRYVNDCLDNNRLSKGKYTACFEREFAAAHQSKHAVFCNSGTSALQIALATLKERYHYEDGDEVLVPAITFIATSNIVIQNGLKPVFVDVDPRTFNMNPDEIALKITDRTRAIIPVHLFGLPADMVRITSIAKYYGLHIIEDSCETMFAGIDGRSVGSFGDMACFSTYVAHIIVGGIGGLVTTNDPKNAEMCRSLLAHGRDNIYLSIDDDDAVGDKELERIIKRRYSFDRVGYSYRCAEIEAALALSEFEVWEENIARRRRNAVTLSQLLQPCLDKIHLPFIPNGYTHSFMMFPMVLRSGDRAPLLMHLEKAGIETRYMFPLLSQPVYRKMFPELEHQYPVAQYLESQGFFIGIHQGLGDTEMKFIADTMTSYFREAL